MHSFQHSLQSEESGVLGDKAYILQEVEPKKEVTCP